MSKETKITVLVVEPQKKPYVKEIDNTLESLQHEVGGYIQAIYPFCEPVTIVCADCAKLEGMPLNRALRDDNGDVYDIIAGTFLIVGLTEDDFGSLSEEQNKQFAEFFGLPELFVTTDMKLMILPLLGTYSTNSVCIKKNNSIMNTSQWQEDFRKNSQNSYCIYQLRDDPKLANILFVNIHYLRRRGIEPSFSNYEAVYSGKLQADGSAEEILDNLYTKFSINYPSNSFIRRLSVSDIIVLRKNGTLSSYYVDSIGFVQIQDFLPKDYSEDN